MAITALPPASIRLLGAGQSIVDPVAVIKELVENALDANASSIVIEIAHNCLEVIQVRDNGHGIPPADRPLVGKRHCTSKIASEEELRSVGRGYLGFRGEALSHLATMSSALIVTTRVEGESAGCQLTFSQDGTLTNSQRKSLAVGTTVRVVDFLATTPVRRQIFTRSSRSTMDRIRTLLQRMAFARPHVRLAFSVLQKKPGNADWLYAPSTNPSITETARKLIGKFSADECQFAEFEQAGVKIQALLPKQLADLAKLKSKGEYVVLDGRPLRTDGGTGRQLLKHLKKHHGWQTTFEGHGTNVFLCLILLCQHPNYDAAIDPSKDDVLFEDIKVVLNVLSALLDAVYPATIHDADPLATADDSTIMVSSGPNVNRMPASTFLTGMSEDFTRSAVASELLTDRLEPQNVDDSADTRLPDTRLPNKMAYNPWSMAKLNAPRKAGQSAPGGPVLPVPKTAVPPQPENTSVERQQQISRISELTIGLPSPVQSSPVRASGIPGSEELSFASRPLQPAQLYLSGTPRSSQLAVPTPFSSPGQRPIQWQATPSSQTGRHSQAQIPPNLYSPRLQSKYPRQLQSTVAVNKTFKTRNVVHPDSDRDAWFQFPETPRGRPPHKRQRQLSNTPVLLSDVPTSKVKSTDIRSLVTPPTTNAAFSSRGPQLIRQAIPVSNLTAILPGSEIATHITSSFDAAACTDHENLPSPSAEKVRRRTLSDRTALAEISYNADDPREFLLHPRTKSGRRKRAKSTMLPLERSLPDDKVQNLQQTVRLSLAMLGRSYEACNPGFPEDSPVPLTCYHALEGFDREELIRIAAKLKKILVETCGSEIKVDLMAVLSRALT